MMLAALSAKDCQKIYGLVKATPVQRTLECGTSLILKLWRETLGQSTTAKCRCGYTCRAVFGGARNATPDRVRFPHYCAQCGVVNANPYRKHSECPECHSAPIHRYGVEVSQKQVHVFGVRLRFLERTSRDWDGSLTNPIGQVRFQWAEFSVTGSEHLCPACEEMTLLFDDQSDCFFD